MQHNNNEAKALNELMSEPASGSSGGGGGKHKAAAKRLADMGFPMDKAEKALDKHNGNEANALNELLMDM